MRCEPDADPWRLLPAPSHWGTPSFPLAKEVVVGQRVVVAIRGRARVNRWRNSARSASALACAVAIVAEQNDLGFGIARR
jgi:transposase